MKPKKLFVFIEAAQQDLVVSLLNLKHTMTVMMIRSKV